MRHSVSPSLMLLLLVALVSGSRAQEQADSEQASQTEATVFGETIDVRVVNVDVWVTDRKGNPVTGLTVEDFEIRESKRPVTITNFYEYVEGREVGTGRAPEPISEQQRRREDLFGTGQKGEEGEVPENQRLSLMVYIDQFNLTPRDRNQVFPHLRQFLRTKVGRNDSVMLVSHMRPPIEVIAPFTTDSMVIADATYELAKHTGGRLRRDSERIDILRELNRDDVAYGNAIALVRQYADAQTTDLGETLDSLRRAVSMMAGLPGRKALLYVSNGLPMRSAEDLFHAVDERFSNSRGQWQGDTSRNPYIDQRPSNDAMEAYQHNSVRSFDQISRFANASRVTFYTLDAGGGLRRGDMGTSNLRFSTKIDSIRTNNLHDSLIRMAEQTGGQAIVGTRDFKFGLDKVANDFRNRYSLGYSPGHGGTGRRYNVEVEIKKETIKRTGKTLRVRYRDNFVDKPSYEEMSEATFAALTMGYEKNPLGIRVEEGSDASRQEPQAEGDFLVTLLVLIPIENVTLLPVGEDFEPRIRLYAQVIDEDQRTSAVSDEVVPMKVMGEDLEAARGKFWPYALKMRMKPGQKKIAVAVRDELSTSFSLLTRDIVVGNGPSAPSGEYAERLRPAQETAEDYLALATAHYQSSELDAMEAAARRALALTEDIQLQARAYGLLGVALFDKPERTPQDLKEAGQAFRLVIALVGDESPTAAHYSLAKVLQESGEIEEAVYLARDILQESPEGPLADQARVLLCHAPPSARKIDDLPTESPSGGPTDTPERPHYVTGDIQKPVKIFEMQPQYTESAREAKIQGRVVLQTIITKEGCIDEVEVAEGLPEGLTESAIAAVKSWVYRPATLNGRPVAIYFNPSMDFQP